MVCRIIRKKFYNNDNNSSVIRNGNNKYNSLDPSDKLLKSISCVDRRAVASFLMFIVEEHTQTEQALIKIPDK